MSGERATIDRILAVRNPNSTRAARADAVIKALMDSKWGGRGKLEELFTRDPTEVDNALWIADHIEPGDVVLGLGGDGLNNDIFRALLEAEDMGGIDPNKAAFMPLPLGNGNDLSFSVYGEDILKNKRLLTILGRAAFTQMDGIEVQRDGESQYAAGFFGMGMTGKGAATLRDEEYRAARQASRLPNGVYDKRLTWRALRDHHPFGAEIDGGPQRELLELIWSLIPRIDGNNIRFNTETFDRKMLEVMISPERFLLQGFIRKMVIEGYGRGGIRGQNVSERHIKLLTDTTVHFNGEPEAVPANTELTVTHRPEIVRVLTG